MECDEMLATIALAQPFRHAPDDRAMRLGLHRSVASEDPDDGCVLVALAEPLAIHPRILGRENLGAFAPRAFVPFVSPGGKESDIDSEIARFLHDGIDAREV